MCRKLCWALGLSMIAVTLVASPVLGQQGRGRGLFGRSQSLVSLVGNEAVQKDIGLTDASKVTPLVDEYRNAMREATSGSDFQGLRDLPEAERAAKMRELTAKLGEIKIQANGIASLSDAAVVKELGLSDEQQKKIADVRAEGEKAQRELFGSGNNQEAFAKSREVTEQTLAKATDVLDAGQKEKLTALKGKPFDVSQLRFGGRAGGRGKTKN
jgi:hypothetical protein